MTKDKATLFQRRGSDMIAGDVSGQTLRGTGTVHRHTTGELPKGMTAIEEAIWKLEQKEKNKEEYERRNSKTIKRN